jgi:HEAT repeat protein
VIGAEDPKQAKRITEALGLSLSRAGPGGATRLHLVKALANYGFDAAEGIPYVLAIITDPAWETRRAAAFALGRLGFASDPKKGPSTAAMKGLANTLLRDDSAAVRLEAAQALILLGPPAYKQDNPADYVQAIRPFLDPVLARQKVEKDKAVQIWLQVLVMRYDGSQLTDSNVLKLAESVTNPDPAARYHALTALGMLGEKARPAVPKMAQALSFEEPELVATALTALAALGEHARAALPDLGRLRGATKDEALKAAVGETIDIITGKKKPPPAAQPGAQGPPMPPKMP